MRVDGMVRAGGEGWAMVEGLERFGKFCVPLEKSWLCPWA